MHCINVHLGLWARSRRFQLEWLAERIRAAVPKKGPLIVAGDFNDWQKKASDYLEAELGLYEVFEQHRGPARAELPGADADLHARPHLRARPGRRGRAAPRGRAVVAALGPRGARRAAAASRASGVLARFAAAPRISVPTPELVSTSSSSACETRPSMMCALFTPFLTASSAHSTLGSMPPEMVPSSIISFTFCAVSPVTHLAFLVEHAGGVGEQDQLLGLQRDRRACRRRCRR